MKRYRNDDDTNDEYWVQTLETEYDISYRGSICQAGGNEFVSLLRNAAQQLTTMKHMRPIVIYLSSNGGDVFVGFTIYEQIRELVHSGCEIEVVAEGFVASAATLVLCAASKRRMRKTATLLIHSIISSGGEWLKPTEMEVETHNTFKLMEILKNVYKRHSNLKKTALEKLLDKDAYLSFDDALALDLIDGS